MAVKQSAKKPAKVSKKPAPRAKAAAVSPATIEGSSRPLRLEYLPAAQLAGNPANWRFHPKEQLDAIDTLQNDVGWAGALLYNEETEHLLDGHGRKELALKRGGVVPVLIGRWTLEQERRILAFYDSVGDMAEVSNEKLEALLVDVGDIAEALQPAVQGKLIKWVQTTVPVASLKEHPRNYKQHPADQIEHIKKSIEEGFFRALVIARDNTILAGHGVRLGAIAAGKKWLPVIRLPLDPDEPRALRILAADNEIGRLAMRDDRALTEMLRETMADGGDLLGTGYDKHSLAALIFTTRAGEVAEFDEAAEWAGMPEYKAGDVLKILKVHCRNDEDMADFVKRMEKACPGIIVNKRQKMMSAWWPPSDRKDVNSLRWQEKAPAEAAK